MPKSAYYIQNSLTEHQFIITSKSLKSMATKKCMNGHQYDSTIYGDTCPFCPNPDGRTRVNDTEDVFKTKSVDNFESQPTEPMHASGAAGGHTVIRGVDGTNGSAHDVRRMVGLLVSYDANPAGEVCKIKEGRTMIGRDGSCDLSFPDDQHMSSRHFLIQYVEAKGAFRAKDQGSSNGSYINGEVFVMDESVELKSNDVIVIGSTKFIFLAIPEF